MESSEELRNSIGIPGMREYFPYECAVFEGHCIGMPCPRLAEG
jgi:hypothetical protein